jgi:hypothetical protein
MRTFLTAGLLGLVVLGLSAPQASAWTNFKFGIGFNFGRQSGGNNFLWGLYRNGQTPGPEYGGDSFFYQPHAFPIYHAGMGAPTHAGLTPAAAAVGPAQAPAGNNAYYYGQPNYRTVTFPDYQTMPSYYFPATFYYYDR